MASVWRPRHNKGILLAVEKGMLINRLIKTARNSVVFLLLVWAESESSVYNLASDLELVILVSKILAKDRKY